MKLHFHVHLPFLIPYSIRRRQLKNEEWEIPGVCALLGATNCPFNRILTLARAKSRIRYSVPTPHNRPVTDERATF